MPPLSAEQAASLEPRVRALVRARFRRFPTHVADEDDLVQYAMLAVTRHARRFDRSRGTQFETWCLTKAYHAIQDAQRALNPGARNNEGRPGLRIAYSLDGPLGDDEDSGTFGDVIEDEQFELPDPFLGRALDAALADLPLDWQSAVALHFEEDMTQDEIGELLGLTGSRISQILKAALARLRSHPALAGCG